MQRMQHFFLFGIYIKSSLISRFSTFSLVSLSLLANIEKKQSCYYQRASSLTPGELSVSQLCEVYLLVGTLVLLSPDAASVSSYHVQIQRWPEIASWGHVPGMK